MSLALRRGYRGETRNGFVISFTYNHSHVSFHPDRKVDSSSPEGRSVTVEVGPDGGVLEILSSCDVTRRQNSEVRHGVATSIPDNWRRASYSTIATTSPTSQGSENASVVCVLGGKGVGKNVFARLVVNSVVFVNGAVSVVEGDCCDPIFGPPGVLTLTVANEYFASLGSLDSDLDASQGTCSVILKALFFGMLPKVLHSDLFLHSFNPLDRTNN